jgi:sugar phosphate permease
MIGHRTVRGGVIVMVTVVVPAAIVGKPDIRASIIIGAIVAGIIGIISSRHCTTGEQQRDESQ